MKGRAICNNESGFTLLEAIVAVTIIGMTIVPIMALISQSVVSLSKVDEAQSRAAATESALAVIEPVNPLETPKGEIDMGETKLTWESETLVEPNESMQIGTGLSGYNVGFYAVTVLLHRNGEPWFSFEARKVGFRRIRGDGPFMNTSR